MAKFYTMGCYTAKGLAGFLNNPSTNRKAATQALVEAGGAKMIDYSLLRGAFDFIAVVDGTFEQMAAAKMVAVSTGTVENFTILDQILATRGIAKNHKFLFPVNKTYFKKEIEYKKVLGHNLVRKPIFCSWVSCRNRTTWI